MQTQTFAEFLKSHHSKTSKSLQDELRGGAFLLVREANSAPLIMSLDPDATTHIGSGAEAEFVVPGLSPMHCELRYHSGFKGWVLVSEEQVGVNGKLAPRARPLLLASRDVIRLPTTKRRIEFYEASALVDRMLKAGATKRVKREGPPPSSPQSSTPQSSAAAERPAASAGGPREPAASGSSSRLTRSGANGVSWGAAS